MTMLCKSPVASIPEHTIQWLELRGWVYELLMDFMSRPPRMSLIALWRKRAVEGQRIPYSHGGERLQNFLKSIPDKEFRQVCMKKAEEYRRLFMGTDSAKSVLVPCEGAFRAQRDGEDALACVARIRSIYLESGVVFNKLFGEYDDHIAMELEFMAVLSEAMLSRAYMPHLLASCVEITDIQLHFLHNHLLQWAPRFADELIGATSSLLYTGLGELLQEFLVYDAAQLDSWKVGLLEQTELLA